MTPPKVTPEQLRQAMNAVTSFNEAGVHFVPIPVASPEDFEQLVTLLQAQMMKLTIAALAEVDDEEVPATTH